MASSDVRSIRRAKAILQGLEHCPLSGVDSVRHGELVEHFGRGDWRQREGSDAARLEFCGEYGGEAGERRFGGLVRGGVRLG